ncbi:MAG: alpha/beta fold hydrolase [Deltaproteobacteria bacterium]|nr:alpha/beta fold hydrolase [Deltaproteobacteria bacterium]
METALKPISRHLQISLQRLKSVILAIAILVSVLPTAAFSQVFQVDIEMPSAAEGGAPTDFRFHGRRFNRQSALNNEPARSRQPVILAHGILNSYGITEKLARFLESQGFDVWVYNQPGFGQEGKVTKAVQSTSGDYGLMALVNGVDKMVEHVTKATGQKPIFGGFSLGGIALELYLQGVVSIDGEGNAEIDKRKSVERQKSISRAVFLGTPVLSFNEMTRGLKLIYGAAYCVGCIVGDRGGFLDFGLGRKGSIVGKAAGVSTALTPSVLLNFYLQDVTNYHNLDADSRLTEKYLASRFSNIHSDLVQDLVKASRKSDNLKSLPLEHVDAIYVVGTKDGLANYKQIRTMFEKRREFNPHHQMITVEGAGHLDLMENKVIESKFGEMLGDRLRSPSNKQWFLMCKDSFRAL